MTGTGYETGTGVLRPRISVTVGTVFGYEFRYSGPEFGDPGPRSLKSAMVKRFHGTVHLRYDVLYTPLDPFAGYYVCTEVALSLWV